MGRIRKLRSVSGMLVYLPSSGSKELLGSDSFVSQCLVSASISIDAGVAPSPLRQ